ncbi:MAG TPA: XrtA system polysaccharide deacetylase [Geminicoccaceae bacterium]
MTIKRANGHHRPEAEASAAERPMITNGLSVDVEDYYQVGAFETRISRGEWPNFASRVEANTATMLDLFDAAQVRATFFVLGWVAERHPQVVRAIVAGGHELASHGYCHTNVTEQTPAAFRADVRDTKRLLEDISGTEVRGYRAANFSIGKGTTWAFGILEDEGYAYSSSIYPMRYDGYGTSPARRAPFTPAEAATLMELPLTTVSLLGLHLPSSGGGYFRLWPYAMSRWALRRINLQERRPCIFYVHPWEIDPKQPRIRGISLKSRFRHYTNLHRVQRRLRRLLDEFHWDRVDRVFLADQPALARHRSAAVEHRPAVARHRPALAREQPALAGDHPALSTELPCQKFA